MICNEKICAYHILLLVLLFIIVYGYVIKEYFKIDILEKKFAECEGCDLWALTHFTLYLILGYNFPSYYLLFFLIGVGYEFFEYYVGVSDNSFKYLGPMSSDGTQSWWYGRVSDIIFNTLGLISGMSLSPYEIKKNKYIII
jgi:hypothetical protein